MFSPNPKARRIWIQEGKMELKTIKNNIWQSTTGEILLEECDVITCDEGETFFCKTHNKELFCEKCEDRV